jgi:hypothetical protein
VTKEEKQKYNRLVEDHKRLAEKLEYLHRGFRGVSHENSAAEMRYTTIQVYEAHIRSIEAAMKELKGED